MNPHLERRLAQLEAARGPQGGPSICFLQGVDGDRREPSDADIERQIVEAIAAGKARDRNDVMLIELVAVHRKPQPDITAST